MTQTTLEIDKYGIHQKMTPPKMALYENNTPCCKKMHKDYLPWAE